MKITRTFLLLAAVAVLLLALTGCRAGARRLNQNESAAATQPALVQPTVEPTAAAQTAPADAQPTLSAAEPTIAGGDAELQDQLSQLEQLDKANQADDPLDDLPQ